MSVIVRDVIQVGSHESTITGVFVMPRCCLMLGLQQCNYSFMLLNAYHLLVVFLLHVYKSLTIAKLVSDDTTDLIEDDFGDDASLC